MNRIIKNNKFASEYYIEEYVGCCINRFKTKIKKGENNDNS
jgi:hypothetical protein